MKDRAEYIQLRLYLVYQNHILRIQELQYQLHLQSEY